MRKSIFQIIEENDDLGRKIRRLSHVFEYERIIVLSDKPGKKVFTMKDIIAGALFSTWTQRNYCVSLDEFLMMLDFDELCENDDFESFITVAELVYNFWMLIYTQLYDAGEAPSEHPTYAEFIRVKVMLDDYLSQCNHRAIHYPEEEKVLVIPDNEAVTAVVEIVDEPMAVDVLHYNHYSLKGDLKTKKAILRNMGDYLEKREKELINADPTLRKAIFHILNMMGIRHMNKQNEANVTKVGENLEHWYDELYQMMLLAILRIDNVERMQKYEAELKPLLT